MLNAEPNKTIEQTLWIQAHPETIWRFLTDPERLAQWWGQAQVDARPHGPLRVQMHDGPRPVMRGHFLELVPHERIAFTFGWEPTPGAPDIPPGTSRVDITLTPDGNGTKLTLRHSGLPAALEDETNHGWAHLLNRLNHQARRHHHN
ncbi:SRPBCC domain-containing protein [Nonomuraea sp. NPDC046570]|uniref:SRPBCC family protein n=1 Tax=Nonomuraea sp. NPDC046570 TaxID=3155255 RepID=UPI0033F40965